MGKEGDYEASWFEWVLRNKFGATGYGNGAPEGVPAPSSGVAGAAGGMGGPGPQRGGSGGYNQPSQSQAYHPYRRTN